MATFRRPAASHRLALPGLGLHYLDWFGTAPPVLLLHPNRTNARVWDFVVEASTLRNRFIAPDARGHGLSDYPESGYDLDDHVADAVALLDALEVEAAILVGAATGGNVGLLLASQFPARVLGLVVADPGLSLDPGISATVQREILNAFRFPSMAEAKVAMPFSRLWSQAMKDHYAEHSFERLASGEVQWRYLPQAARHTEAALEQDMWSRIRVSCPTLILRGGGSHVFPARNMVRLQRLIDGSESRVVPDCDHRISQDQPERMAAMIDDFVARRLAPGGARQPQM